MSTKLKILAGFLLLALGLLIYLESSEPGELNWFPSYAQKDKIPYGSYVLYSTLKEARQDEGFREVNRPPFEFLADSSDAIKGTYFFLNEYISFDEAESLSILEWVAQGNTLYVGARGVGETILDTLNLDTEILYSLNNLERKPLVQLSNLEFRKEHPYYIDIEIRTSAYFNQVDTVNTRVLGTYDLSKSRDSLIITKPKVHFIKQDFGQGTIVLHLMPDVFTNYFMLRKDHYTYTQDALQYLPETGAILWDNHYKNGKTIYTSPLYILFKNRYMKWAYYTVIIGTLLWVFFEGKRKQRAIPIIKPLPNQTLAFTKTIAGMYFEKGDHKSIATHQINHFMEHIRSEWGIPTATRNSDFIQRLASKTDHPIQETKRLIDYITAIEQRKQITQEELLKLNTLIEAFKKA